MAVVPNPYASQDLFISGEVSDRISDFVARSEKEAAKPFPRQVDAWWVAMGVGVRLGQRTPLPEKTVKFNDGGILASDPWRIAQLELLAVSQLGIEAIESPGQVIRMASEFANAGFEWLFDKLIGEAEPTLTLANRIEEFC
jgi:hypothetical protein